jgi:hypothetical protein
MRVSTALSDGDEHGALVVAGTRGGLRGGGGGFILRLCELGGGFRGGGFGIRERHRRRVGRLEELGHGGGEDTDGSDTLRLDDCGDAPRARRDDGAGGARERFHRGGCRVDDRLVRICDAGEPGRGGVERGERGGPRRVGTRARQLG